MIEYLEYLLIGIVIIFQFHFYFKTIKETAVFNRIFDSKPLVNAVKLPRVIVNKKSVEEIVEMGVLIIDNPESDEAIELNTLGYKVEISFLKNNSKNPILIKVINQVNSYLLKNISKTIDFHIIQDIVDRNVETQEERLERLSPTPLYLGLAATMIGIIFGLSSINFESTGGMDIVEPLIHGVRLAMIASVTGLILTTILSVVTIRKAKFDNETNKNDFLSFIQAELMPKMNKAKMPEVKELSDNLQAFSETSLKNISSLSGIVQQTSESLRIEGEILSNIKALDLKKLSTNTVEIFQQSYGLLDNLKDFNNYYLDLNQSLKSTSQLVDKLDGFVRNTDNLGTVLSDLKEGIIRSANATEFFNKHIKSFSQYNDKVNDAVSTSDLAFKQAIISLKEVTESEIIGISDTIANFDRNLTDSFDQTTQKYFEIVENEKRKLEETFNDSKSLMQKLNKLDNLDKIEGVFKSSNRDVIDAINNLAKYFAMNNNSSSTGKVFQTEIKESFDLRRLLQNIIKGRIDLKRLLQNITYGLVSLCALLYIINTLFN